MGLSPAAQPADADRRVINQQRTCVIILSDKSCGSSALQEALLRIPGITAAAYTQHYERETLYWVKAVAALDLPQTSLSDGRYLPVPRDQAIEELERLLEENVGSVLPRTNMKEWLFASWRTLVECRSPIFVEKSPHHLHSLEALALMRECDAALDDLDFRYIGLIRGPQATLYSMWRRWGVRPEARQGDWCRAYSNLRSHFRQVQATRALLVRYEELVTDPAVFTEIVGFVGVDALPRDPALSAASVNRWRRDCVYGFQPDPQTREVAGSYAYTTSEPTRPQRLVWPIARELRIARRAVAIGSRRLRRTGGGRAERPVETEWMSGQEGCRRET